MLKYIFYIIFVLIKFHLTTLYAEECSDFLSEDNTIDLNYKNAYEMFYNKDYKGAMREFNISAEKGNKKAQYYLGIMHDVGLGIERDPLIAASFYKKAIDNGDVESGLKLGLKYLYGIDDFPIDYKMAKKLLTPSAEKGYLYAEFYLSMMHLNGWGVPKNDDTAWKFFKSFIEKRIESNDLKLVSTNSKEGLISINDSVFMSDREAIMLLEVSMKHSKSKVFKFALKTIHDVLDNLYMSEYGSFKDIESSIRFVKNIIPEKDALYKTLLKVLYAAKKGELSKFELNPELLLLLKFQYISILKSLAKCGNKKAHFILGMMSLEENLYSDFRMIKKALYWFNTFIESDFIENIRAYEKYLHDNYFLLSMHLLHIVKKLK